MQISSTKIRASLVVTEPVAQVTHVSIGASVYNVLPLANISYVLMAVDARADTTGRYRYVPEYVVTTDNKYISFQKPASDSVSASDFSARNVGKVLNESISFTEVFTRTLIFIRSFTETAVMTEVVAKSVSRTLSDVFSVDDSRIKVFFKNVTNDPVSTYDAKLLSVAKLLTDAFSPIDSKSLSVSKRLADQFSTTDSATRSVSKRLADSLAFTEVLTRSFSKSLTDGVGMNDSAETTDGLLFAITKSFSNVAFATDAKAIGFTKAQTDAVSTSDSGSGVSQSYCDPTYFAEDYVGSSFTF